MRRHPNAPPKIKRYIRMFGQLSHDLRCDNKHYLEQARRINQNIDQLTNNVKKVLTSAPRKDRNIIHLLEHSPSYERRSSSRTKPKTFITDHVSKPSSSLEHQNIPQPKMSNAVMMAMPTRPAYGAYRFYDSIPTLEMRVGQEILKEEIEKHPILATEYTELEPKIQVDPFLHVGGFARFELMQSPEHSTGNSSVANFGDRSTDDC